MEGMSAPSRLAGLTRAFAEAGGRGPKVLIRRVWLGRVSDRLVAEQRAVYESYAGRGGAFAEDQTLADDDPAALAERLAAAAEAAGADALNLRVQLPGMAREEVRDQITAIGTMVVEQVRGSWSPAG
jgi:hypothetical protein